MKDNYDLKSMKKRPGKVKVDPGAASVMISMRIDADLLGKIKAEARRLGIPYQAHMKSLLHQYINGDLVHKEVKDDDARMA
jgi:predicted DNA binding CopG/RHH family protein